MLDQERFLETINEKLDLQEASKSEIQTMYLKKEKALEDLMNYVNNKGLENDNFNDQFALWEEKEKLY